MLGEDKSSELLSPERPAFIILNRYIDQAREDGILTDLMKNEEIIYAFMAFKHGLMAYWELERGGFDIIQRNRAAICNLFSGLRKNRAD